MTVTTVYTREEAAARSLQQNVNVPDTCQLVTRTWLGAPSAGDFDGDGAADAEDGWKKEPQAARHYDRRPPLGSPVTYLGGSHDNGHRALSLGPDKSGVYHIRSTDGGGRGRVATVPLDWPEKTWGLNYVGWSDTCDGFPIKPSPPKRPATRGKRVEAALVRLRAARAKSEKGSSRAKLLDRAIAALVKIQKT
jgi:hypothetical protein